MTKRQREEESDDDDIDEIVKAAVKEALKKHKVKKEPKESSFYSSIMGILPFQGSPETSVQQQIKEIAGDIIHNGELMTTEILEGGTVQEYSFDVKFPNMAHLTKLEELSRIEGIVRTQVEKVPGKFSFTRVVMTYTLDTKLEMRFRKDEGQKLQDITTSTEPDEGTRAFQSVINHIRANIEIDKTEEPVRKSEKSLGNGILLVSIAQAIKSPTRLEQLQRLRHHSLIRDVAVIGDPKSDKIRVVLDFLKEKPDG